MGIEDKYINESPEYIKRCEKELKKMFLDSYKEISKKAENIVTKYKFLTADEYQGMIEKIDFDREYDSWEMDILAKLSEYFEE